MTKPVADSQDSSWQTRRRA